jgi:multiple sugar transport system permease protein
MSAALVVGRPARKLRRYRLRRIGAEAAALALGCVLLIWSLLPVYNMLLIALDPEGDTEFAGYLWPAEASLESFRVVLTESYWYLENFWKQFGNSFYVGLPTMFLTMLIASLASFVAGRMRLGTGRVLVNAPLLSYVLPSSFLAIPFLLVTRSYGLADSLWAVIAAEVMFATPFAVLILQSHARLVPMELDDAARVDGASPLQVYFYIYLPLMAPALAAVGTFALLLSWSEHLYQYLLLSSQRNWTVAVALEQFWDADEAPWNYMMALAIVYALPPLAIFFALSRYVAVGLSGRGISRARPR